MIGKRLKVAMESRDINQRQLSIMTGLTEATISRYVNCERGNFKNLIILCKTLGVSADWLLGLKGSD